MKSTGGGKAAPSLPSAKPTTARAGGMKTTFGTRVMKGKR